MNYKDISYSESNPICTVDYNQQSIDILKNTEGKTIYVGNKSSDKSSCVGNYSKQTLTITSDTAGCSGSVSQNDETAGKISIVVSKNEEKQDRIIIYKINNIALIYIKQSANATDTINYYINIVTSTASGYAEIKFEQPSGAGATAGVSISKLAWGQYAEGPTDISNIEIVDASHAVDYRDISNYVILVDLNDNCTYTFSYLTFDLFGNEGKDGAGDMSTFTFYGYNVSKNTGSFSINEDITFQSGHTYELQWKDSSNIPNIFNLDPTDCSDNYIFKGFNWIGPLLQYKCSIVKNFSIECQDSQKQTLTVVENETDTGFTFYYRIQIQEDPSVLSDNERKAIINYIYDNMTKNIVGTQFITIKNKNYEEAHYYNYPNTTIQPNKDDEFTITTDKISVTYDKFDDLSSSFEKYKLYIKLAPILTIINDCCLTDEYFTLNGCTYKLCNTDEPFTYNAVYEYDNNGVKVVYLETVRQDVN